LRFILIFFLFGFEFLGFFHILLVFRLSDAIAEHGITSHRASQ